MPTTKKQVPKVLLPAKLVLMLKQCLEALIAYFMQHLEIPPKGQNVFALGAQERQVSYRAMTEELNYLLLHRRLVLENYLIVSAQNTTVINPASFEKKKRNQIVDFNALFVLHFTFYYFCI